jgi:hypothetical protein
MRGVLLQAAATALVFFFLLPWSFNQPRIPIIVQKLEQISRKFLLFTLRKKKKKTVANVFLLFSLSLI